jgi:periplasmic copper chaperone A
MQKLLSTLILLSNLSSFVYAETLQVSEAWVSESPPGVSINAAYLTISNTGESKVILNAVSSPDFKKIEMHRSLEADGKARMQLQNQLEIEAGTDFSFSPGDYHLMLFSPLKEIRAGDMTSLTLHFASGNVISVSAEVRKLQSQHLHHH